MLQHKKFREFIPPCPDLDKYILVKGKYGYYWRKNRGSVKPARLNEALQRSADCTSRCNEAAKQLLLLLSPYTRHMALSLAPLRLAGAFKKAYLKTSHLHFGYMKDFVFQEDHPTWKLFVGEIMCDCENDVLQVKVNVGEYWVRKPADHATGYQVHLLLLYTNPSGAPGILIETEESRLYSFGEASEDCDLSLVLPSQNRAWMALVYIGCLLKEGYKSDPRFHVMVVAGVST